VPHELFVSRESMTTKPSWDIILPQVMKAQDYILKLWFKTGDEITNVVHNSMDGKNDILYWVKEYGGIPTRHNSWVSNEVDWGTVDQSAKYWMVFPIYMDGQRSDLSAECSYDNSKDLITIDDIHVL
jgi:hypothetical protein